MTIQEALGLLGLGEGPPQPEQLRRAYVRQVQGVRLAVDPETAHAQIDVAASALALLKQWTGPQRLDAQSIDARTSMIFSLMDELSRLGESFPLDLRQVAARAAKRGDFQNTPYEARFATRLLSASDTRTWRKRLKQDAPTLARILGLDLKEDQLRPRGTPNFRIPVG